MKAPLSCSVLLACDLLALSKSCNAINDDARGGEGGGKKKSKGHKQGGFDRPLLLGHWLYGRVSHDIVWLCVSLHKSKWSVSSALSAVKYLWLWVTLRVGRAAPLYAFVSVVEEKNKHFGQVLSNFVPAPHKKNNIWKKCNKIKKNVWKKWITLLSVGIKIMFYCINRFLW